MWLLWPLGCPASAFPKALFFACPCAPIGPGAGGVRAMQQHNSPCHPCAAARKAFPSSRIPAGYPTPNTGLTHLSLSRGARTPPLLCPTKGTRCAVPTGPGTSSPGALGTPGSIWILRIYLTVSHHLPQPLLPGMLRMQKLRAAQTSFYPYIVSAYTLPSQKPGWKSLMTVWEDKGPLTERG